MWAAAWSNQCFLKRRAHDEWIRQQKLRFDRTRQNQSSQSQRSSQPPPPSASTEEQGEDDLAASAVRIRPWVRLWARFIDTFLFGVAYVLLTAVFFPRGLVLTKNSSGLWMLVLFLWVFVETLLLVMFGRTPGKWLLGINIEDKSGRVLLGDAFGRSLKVWWRGLGAGIPIVTMITQVVAYRNLTARKECTWDAEHSFFIMHEKIGGAKLIAAIVIIAVAFLMAMVSGF